MSETTPVTYETPPNGFRTFLIVWVSQSVSVFGSALTFFATTIWLTQVLYPQPEQKPDLALALSAIALAFALPTVTIAPIAGAWADRHDRKRTMMAMDFISGCLSVLLATLMATETLQLWMLIAWRPGLRHRQHVPWRSVRYLLCDAGAGEAIAPRQRDDADDLVAVGNPVAGLAASIIALPGLARQGLVPGAVGATCAALKTARRSRSAWTPSPSSSRRPP